jgi:hypothetical protein
MAKSKQEELWEQHLAMREDLMSEEDIKLCDKYLDYFRSSWMDKDARGLFDKWEMADLYWEGDVNLPESDDDPGSNTNIVNANVEGQVALTVENNIAVQADATEPSDVPFSEHARIIGQFIVDKNRMKKKIESVARRRKKFGNGIITVIWDPDKLDGIGLPWFKSWNPAYVFFDPNATEVDETDNGRFQIFICNKSIFWAEEMFDEDHAQAIMPGYHPIESEWLFGEKDGETDEISQDNYMHMFVFTKKKKKLRLVQMSGCGIKLWDSKDHPEIKFPEGKYPTFIAPDMPREGTAHSKAGVELLFNGQDIINDLDDQIRINARLSGNIQKVVGTASGIDIDKWTNEPGLNIPAADPDAWKMVQPPQMPQYILDRRREALFQERQIVSRFSDQMAGIQQRGVDTATEALALQQSGLAGIDHDKTIIEETLAEALEYALELAKENWTEEQAFKITGKRNEFLWYRPSKLKNIPKLIPASEEYRRQFAHENPDAPVPEYMAATNSETGEVVTKNAKFDMTVSIGAGIPNNKAFRYTVVKEAFVQGAMDIPEYRQRLRDFGALPESEYEQEKEKVAKLEMIQMMKANKGMLNPMAGGTAGEEGRPNADIEGLSPSGRSAALRNLGGGPNDYITQQR